MQHIFKEVGTLDKRCYADFALTEDVLMEHAAASIAGYIKNRFSTDKKIMIVAGPGNNGADGLALARLLYKDYPVSVYLPLGAKSTMAGLQLTRVQKIGLETSPELEKADVLVDCLFGSGFNRSLGSPLIELIKHMNRMKSFKIACDMPSGINMEGISAPVAFNADVTITMGALKVGLFSDMAKDSIGEIRVADLGVSRKIYETQSNYYMLEEHDLKLPKRKKQNTHKGQFGHLAVFSGDKEGAAIIAGKAALNFGAGLVTLVSPKKIANDYELMQSRSLPSQATAIACGMGLGEDCDEIKLLKKISGKPLIIDADMFYKKIMRDIVIHEKPLVFTPHPKEFASLLKILNIEDVTVEEIQNNRFILAEKFTNNFPRIVLVLKGANPIIACQGNFYINAMGSPALSKAGSGDVFSGLIGALLAQGMNALESAINASIAHTLAANRALSFKNDYALTPTDIIREISQL